MLEREYARDLRILFVTRLQESIRERILPRLPALVAEARAERPRVTPIRIDAWPDEVAELRRLMDIDLEGVEGAVTQRAQDMSVRLNQSNRSQWSRAMRGTIGVDIIAAEPGLRNQLATFTRQNASLIRKMQTDAINDIEGAVQRGLQQGLRVEEIRDDILGRVEVSANRAQFIARDQVAKFSGQLNETRQTSIGVTEYVWRTSRDERVRGRPGGLYPRSRPSHWAMEGKTCVWDDPTVYIVDGERVPRSTIGGVEKHPGQDFQCRCTAEAVLDDLFEGL
jgi:SPP1 gp7 family putative phage head morphogenesis protein